MKLIIKKLFKYYTNYYFNDGIGKEIIKKGFLLSPFIGYFLLFNIIKNEILIPIKNLNFSNVNKCTTFQYFKKAMIQKPSRITNIFLGILFLIINLTFLLFILNHLTIGYR